MKVKTKIAFKIYQVLRSIRYNFLKSGLGYVNHCKHHPTCGTYLIRQIDEKGILVGSVKGFWRVLQCW